MDLRSNMMRHSAVFSFNLILFIGLLFCVEFLWRVCEPQRWLYEPTYPGRYQNAPFTKETSLMEPDEYLGWVFNKESSLHDKNGVSYQANKQGFRDRKDFYSAGPGSHKKRVMILGDSFVFGLYINQKDTIPELLQKKWGMAMRSTI